MTGRGDGARGTVVGFAGLGRMGWPMAANVARAGFPLRVFNRTRERAERFVGAVPGVEVCGTPAEMATGCNVVVTMLADGPAVDDVYLAEEGLIAGARPGTIFVDMSTIGPDHVAMLADKLGSLGLALVDAPVSGSVATATSGELLVMAGGDPSVVQRVRPVLDAVGATVLYLGPSGAGATVKLVVNTVIYGLNQSVSEALVFAEVAGLDRLATYEVFAHSAIAAPFVHYRREAFERPGEVPVAFRVELASKDLRLILDLAGRVGADLPQAQTNLAILEETESSGLRDEDVSAVARYLRGKNRAPPSRVPERGG